MNEKLTNSLYLIVIFTGLFGCGFLLGRYSLPAEIVEKEKIVYQDRIVEKKVEIKDVKKKDHKIIVRFEKTMPDGTKTVETKIMDDSSTESSSTTTDNKTEDVTKVDEKEKTTIFQTNDTIVSLLASTHFSDITLGPNLGLSIQRKFIGPIYIGAFGYKDKSFGLSLGIVF